MWLTRSGAPIWSCTQPATLGGEAVRSPPPCVAPRGRREAWGPSGTLSLCPLGFSFILEPSTAHSVCACGPVKLPLPGAWRALVVRGRASPQLCRLFSFVSSVLISLDPLLDGRRSSELWRLSLSWRLQALRLSLLCSLVVALKPSHISLLEPLLFFSPQVCWLSSLLFLRMGSSVS